MAFSSFRAQVLLRVLLIVAMCAAFVWSWLATRWVVTPWVCGALALFGVIELIRYVESTARELASFLRFVAHHDFSTPLAAPRKGRVFQELEDAYRLLAGEFRHLNRQRAANHQYLEAVVEHVGVALVCFDGGGNVRMINEPARRLLGVPFLGSLRSFSRIDERLPELLARLADGERSLVSVRRDGDTLQLVLYATTFELLEQHYKLVSFQNIRDELDRQEIESWQKLIRVLTHEIMNSVTPIISLSRLIRETMIDDSRTPATFRALTTQEQDDMLRSVTAIHTRSSGLLDFVQAYRSFARLPAPVPADVNVCALLERVRTLTAQQVESRPIAIDLQCAPGLVVHADAAQVEQVLINLTRNAVEALTDSTAPRIGMRAFRDDQERVVIEVGDNGPGIDPEHLDKIFVPFFTTKRSGSGIGLSISRQIMQANRGVITVRSAPGEGCTFALRFR